jgi:hypothetical protein
MQIYEDHEARQARVAAVQALARRLNERAHGLRERVTPVQYVCECTLKLCGHPLTLSADEYDQVRSSPTHFVLAPGHPAGTDGRVVRETPLFTVIEKLGIGGEVAARLDPRPRAGALAPLVQPA